MVFGNQDLKDTGMLQNGSVKRTVKEVSSTAVVSPAGAVLWGCEIEAGL